MPKQAPNLPLPSIRPDTTGEQPLHHQLYAQLSQAIRTGQLKPGTGKVIVEPRFSQPVSALSSPWDMWWRL